MTVHGIIMNIFFILEYSHMELKENVHNDFTITSTVSEESGTVSERSGVKIDCITLTAQAVNLGFRQL